MMEALSRQQIIDPYEFAHTKKARQIFEEMKQHKEPYSTDVLGESIVVHPNVFSPKYVWDTRFVIENMTCPNGKKVLDVGTGTGAIGLFCAMRGATLVHAVDINESALTNAQENFTRHRVDDQHFKVYYSNVFSNVNEKFDIILFNPPLCPAKAADDLERGGLDEDHSPVRRFMAEAGSYLEPDGRVCVTWSDIADMALMRGLIEQNNFQMDKFFEECEDGITVILLILKRENK